MLTVNFIVDTTVTQVSMLSLQTVITIGSSAIIVCNITLNTVIGPDLSVLNYYWYHNNIDITNRSEILEHTRGTNFVTTILNITSVQLYDAGVYECRAGIVDGYAVTNDTNFCLGGKDEYNT